MTIKPYLMNLREKFLPGKDIKEIVVNEYNDFVIVGRYRKQFWVFSVFALAIFIFTVALALKGAFYYSTNVVISSFIPLAAYFLLSDFSKRKDLLSQPVQFYVDSFFYLVLMSVIIIVTGSYESPVWFPLLLLTVVSAPLYARGKQVFIFFGLVLLTIILIFSSSEAFFRQDSSIILLDLSLLFFTSVAIKVYIDEINKKNLEVTESEEKYHAITDTSPDCIKLFDKKGGLLYMSKGGLDEHGLKDLEEAKKIDLIESIIEEDQHLFQKGLNAAISGKINTIEIRHTAKGSKRRVCLETFAPVKDSSGKIIAAFGVSRDLSDIKKAEHDLGKRMKELTLIYETSKIMEESAEMDQAFREIIKKIPLAYQFPEIACAKIIYNGKEYKTKNFKETKWMQSENILISGKKSGSLEVFYLEKKPFLIEEKKMLMEVVLQIKNIAERKKADERIRSLDMLKSRFITALTHVTRTPLNRIRWMIESILSGDVGELNEEQEPFLRQVLDNEEQILRLITNMNLVLDIERDTLVLDKHKTSITSLVKSVMDSFQEECKLKKLKWSIITPRTDYPSLSIDAEKLRKALGSIIDNALRYSNEKGSIIVRFSKAKNWITIKITDKGVGIPKAEQASIFERFFRASNASTMFTGGVGLGLYIAKSIVEAHGGEIGFKSQEGKGSEFWIKLPISS